MAPALLETEIFSYLKDWKTAKPKHFTIEAGRESGLPAEIERITTSADQTIVRLTSLEKYGGLPSESNITVSGDVVIQRGVELVKKLPGTQPQEMYVMKVIITGEGSKFSYEIPGGAKPIRRPNKVIITHKNTTS